MSAADLRALSDSTLSTAKSSLRWPFEGWSPVGLWSDGRVLAPRESQWVVVYTEAEAQAGGDVPTPWLTP
jgi:hypothetical protein